MAARIFEIDVTWQARALAVLRKIDYVLVVTCGMGALSMLAALLSTLLAGPTAGWLDAVFPAVAGVLAAGGAAVGWRHIGVIAPRVWRAYSVVMAIYLVAGLASLLLAVAAGWGASWSDPKDQQSILSSMLFGVIGAWCVVMCPLALGALWILARSRISPFGLGLHRLVGTLASHASGQPAGVEQLPRIDARRGRAYAAVAAVAALVWAAWPAADDLRHQGDQSRLFQVALAGIAYLAFQARRYLQVDADALLAVDRRPPILFLRSFDDDEKITYGRADRALIDFSLETRLATHFRDHGPFVAIGSPKEKLPQVGAARVLLPDDRWQARVLEWMHAAALVVMYAGRTPWVNWELGQVLSGPGATRLLLLVPESRAWRRRKRLEDLRERHRLLCTAFAGTPWHEELVAWDDLESLRGMVFNGDGSVVAIRSRSRSRDSYHLAAIVGHYVLLERVGLPAELAKPLPATVAGTSRATGAVAPAAH